MKTAHAAKLDIAKAKRKWKQQEWKMIKTGQLFSELEPAWGIVIKGSGCSHRPQAPEKQVFQVTNGEC